MKLYILSFGCVSLLAIFLYLQKTRLSKQPQIYTIEQAIVDASVALEHPRRLQKGKSKTIKFD